MTRLHSLSIEAMRHVRRRAGAVELTWSEENPLMLVSRRLSDFVCELRRRPRWLLEVRQQLRPQVQPMMFCVHSFSQWKPVRRCTVRAGAVCRIAKLERGRFVANRVLAAYNSRRYRSVGSVVD